MSSFQSVSEIVIPEKYHRPLLTGDPKVDGIFGNGIIAGTSMTLTAVAGSGKCHHQDEEIEIYADEKIIKDIERFLSKIAG